MTMVEKVARAVRRNRFERTGRGGVFNPDEPLTDNELDDATAALRAMLEPTQAMLWAHELPHIGPDELREFWTAAINAALEVGETG